MYIYVLPESLPDEQHGQVHVRHDAKSLVKDRRARRAHEELVQNQFMQKLRNLLMLPLCRTCCMHPIWGLL